MVDVEKKINKGRAEAIKAGSSVLTFVKNTIKEYQRADELLAIAMRTYEDAIREVEAIDKELGC